MPCCVIPLVGIQCKSVVCRHSRLATLLHKLADAMVTDGRLISITEKPRPLSLTSGAIADVEVGKVGHLFACFVSFSSKCCIC